MSFNRPSGSRGGFRPRHMWPGSGPMRPPWHRRPPPHFRLPYAGGRLQERFCVDEIPEPPPIDLCPQEVMDWLNRQHPSIVGAVMHHCGALLGERPQDLDSWYSSDKPPDCGLKRPLGSGPPEAASCWKNPGGPLQWTPAGWAPKDSSHKVTSLAMKPLPEPDIIPANGCSQYPDAAADRSKLQLLQNNANLLNLELNKICKQYNLHNFKKDADLSAYPEDLRQRLETAVTCVKKAEQTLDDFKRFLRTEKYKAWNEEQQRLHQKALRDIIGDTPTGTPHRRPQASGSDSPAPTVSPTDTRATEQAQEAVE